MSWGGSQFKVNLSIWGTMSLDIFEQKKGKKNNYIDDLGNFSFVSYLIFLVREKTKHNL